MNLCRSIFAIVFITSFLFSEISQGQDKDLRQKLDELQFVQNQLLFKTIDDVELKLHIFEPENRETKVTLPAIVFFFGGGWIRGTAEHFYPQSKYLASRGMVAICAEYRVNSVHGTSPIECVADAKSAIRWVRAHARELGIDPNRIAAGGGSAGGHLAACTGVLKGFDEKNEDTNVNSVPNAMVLFNPALDIKKLREIHPENPISSERMKKYAEDISPVYHVMNGAPPTIIFHGKKDKTVPFEQAERFCRLMKEAGNTCTLVPFEGKEHGFFNLGRYENKPFVETMRATDRFLSELGYLKGVPTL